jgi:predicted dehydrogenase
MIGAGFMGRGIALQIATATPGMELVAICNRSVERAIDAEATQVADHLGFEITGHSVDQYHQHADRDDQRKKHQGGHDTLDSASHGQSGRPPGRSPTRPARAADR